MTPSKGSGFVRERRVLGEDEYEFAVARAAEAAVGDERERLGRYYGAALEAAINGTLNDDNRARLRELASVIGESTWAQVLWD